MEGAATASNDKTANKVALCSAMFAGFAYVGYSMVKNAFGKKGKRESEGNGNEHRLYFRRLSQTTQTDVLLGNLDMSGSGKVLLRSVTVQERIRELNLRARMFTDTMLAIQGSTRLSHPKTMVAKSLQGSPWSSPRILSPVDVQNIINSRSSENLHFLESEVDFPISSPLRRRWARHSFRRKSPSPSNKSHSYCIEDSHKHEEALKESEKMLQNNENEIKKRLETILDRVDLKITKYEAKSLAALLHTKDEVLLQKVVTTIGNCGTFEDNQNVLREAGCLVLLAKLLSHYDYNVTLATIKTLGNLALNSENQKELKPTLSKLIALLRQENISDEETESILVTLTNFAILTDCHGEFFPVIPIAYDFIAKNNPAIKLQALKLFINLSCNEDMVPSLLAAQAPRRLLGHLDMSVNEDFLLRVVTFLSNLTQAVKDMQLDPTIDLPPEDKAASPDTIRYAAIYGVNALDKLRSKLLNLVNKHENQEIRNYCKKILNILP